MGSGSGDSSEPRGPSTYLQKLDSIIGKISGYFGRDDENLFETTGHQVLFIVLCIPFFFPHTDDPSWKTHQTHRRNLVQPFCGTVAMWVGPVRAVCFPRSGQCASSEWHLAGRAAEIAACVLRPERTACWYPTLWHQKEKKSCITESQWQYFIHSTGTGSYLGFSLSAT